MKLPPITPGLWEAGLDLPAAANNNPDKRLVWSGSLLVADCRIKWIEQETAKANAKAIAAVPELIGALRRLLRKGTRSATPSGYSRQSGTRTPRPRRDQA